MASTIITVSTSLDVIDRYRELVEASLDGDSIYIRAKETVERLYENSDLTDAKKAEVIANTIASMANSISASSMQLALQWESQEAELGLKKEELEYRIDLMKLEAEKAEYDANLVKESVRLAQAKRIREYGDATFDTDGNVIALSNEGLVYEQEQLVKKQIEQGTAAINKLNDDLLTAAKQRLNVEKQTELYQRQKEGFDDNKYQKLFDSQINAWGLMFSSGMLTEKPAIITGDKVSQLYSKLTLNI